VKYDAVVVGAGPAGSMTALSILREDPEKKDLLVDKRKELGRPVQCAGGIVKDRLDLLDLPDLPEEVIAQPCRGAVLHGPGGAEAVWDGGRTRGYVMHRDRFDQWLAALACEAGAELRREDPACTDPPYDYRCRYLVGADGWRSQLGKRFFGKSIDLGIDYHTGVEYLVHLDEPHDTSFIHLYFGNYIAPGGYIWVFPESDHLVRVGCGVVPGLSARSFLNRFLDTGEWAGERIGVSAGGIIPTSRPVACLHAEVMRPGGRYQRVALVGDAARMTDPVHGGGIANAMEAAVELGKVIAEDGELLKYSIWFEKNMEKELERRYLLKKVMAKWNDSEMDAMVEVMSQLVIRDDVPVNELVRSMVLKLALKKPLMFPKALGNALIAKFTS